MRKRVKIESSAWMDIDLTAIANYNDDIEISDEEYIEEERCYCKKIKFQATEKSYMELYNLIKHKIGECDEDTCKFCAMTKKLYY